MVSTPTIRGLSRIEREFSRPPISGVNLCALAHICRGDANGCNSARLPAGREGTALRTHLPCEWLRAPYRRAHKDGDAGARRIAGQQKICQPKKPRVPPSGALLSTVESWEQIARELAGPRRALTKMLRAGTQHNSWAETWGRGAAKSPRMAAPGGTGPSLLRLQPKSANGLFLRRR